MTRRAPAMATPRSTALARPTIDRKPSFQRKGALAGAFSDSRADRIFRWAPLWTRARQKLPKPRSSASSGMMVAGSGSAPTAAFRDGSGSVSFFAGR